MYNLDDLLLPTDTEKVNIIFKATGSDARKVSYYLSRIGKGIKEIRIGEEVIARQRGNDCSGIEWEIILGGELFCIFDGYNFSNGFLENLEHMADGYYFGNYGIEFNEHYKKKKSYKLDYLENIW